MHRTTRVASYLAPSLSLFLVAAPATAGSLVGSARTVVGTPLPQVVLSVEGPAASTLVVAGPEGRFHVDSLPPGDYTVSARVPGLVLQGAPTAHVDDGEAHIDVVFTPAPVREHIVVAATRGEAPLSALGVTVTVLDGDRIADRELSDFAHVLQDVPGVAVARAGGVGLQSSAFVRGGESNFARVLVDGIPVNEPGGFFNFGSQLPLELERVEVVRGAASSLYGTDALAGVVQLVTRTAGPSEGTDVRGEAEGGTFSWRRYGGGTSGRHGAFDWNLGVTRLDTENQQPNGDFGETAGAASLGARLGDRSLLRFVLRGEDTSAGTPGPTGFGRPDLDARFDTTSLVVGGDWRFMTGAASHQVRLGFARSDQLSRNPLDSGTYTPTDGERVGAYPISDVPDPAGFQNDVRRLSAGYEVEAHAGRANLVTAGVDVEHESGAVGSRPEGLITPARTNAGAYVQDQVVVGAGLFVTVGARVERNDNFGTRVVPRAAVAWRAASTASSSTTVRASAGAGIKEPSFFQSFGASFYALGNPDLAPERSRTYDLGVEQRLGGDRLRAEATVFHHDYLDQIAYHLVDPTTYQGTYVNLGKTRARGRERACDAAPTPRLRLGASYTLLDGEVLVSSSDFDPVYAAGQPLLRRPRHQGSVWARADLGRLTLGANVVAVGRRTDSDFVGLGLTENSGYTRLDARAHLRLGAALELFVAGENLLDARYQEVLGYPALGRSVRVGVRLRKMFRS
jgi:vitamin B12 transporter